MQPSPAGGEFGTLRTVLLKQPLAAFRDQARVDREWRSLGFTAPPDVLAAQREYAEFIALLDADMPLEVVLLEVDDTTTLDSIYVRDASIVSAAGLILGRMGKPARAAEPAAQRRACQDWPLHIAGAIVSPGTLEGGDVLWLDERTIAVGRGYRTNDEGIRQLRAILGHTIDDLIVVPLPHWRGAGDVFHLMSIISPVDDNLAVVYLPLMPVPFVEQLSARGMQFVEVPDAEFETMGANVLAVGPRDCVMVAGNPETQARLEAAGARVRTYDGTNISLKGGGGPTCLTRPLSREGAAGRSQKAEVRRQK
jgi:N-dimethylarginine dimethylaminohydrolase